MRNESTLISFMLCSVLAIGHWGENVRMAQGSCSAGLNHDQELTRLNSRELAFEISFPAEPIFSVGRKKFLWTCTGAEPHKDQYVVQVSRTAGKPSAALIKRALVPSLAGSYSIQVVKDTTFGEFPCVYFTFDKKNQGDTIRTGRVVWDDHRIFILEMKGTAAHPVEHWFFNSLVLHPFQLTNPLPKR